MGQLTWSITVSREVYINDRYTWLSHEQLTAALTYYLADMRRVDTAIRAGGDFGIIHGMDDIPEHNSLMYQVNYLTICTSIPLQWYAVTLEAHGTLKLITYLVSPVLCFAGMTDDMPLIMPRLDAGGVTRARRRSEQLKLLMLDLTPMSHATIFCAPSHPPKASTTWWETFLMQWTMWLGCMELPFKDLSTGTTLQHSTMVTQV